MYLFVSDEKTEALEVEFSDDAGQVYGHAAVQGGNYRHRTARRRNAQLAGHSDRNFERGHRHILAAPVERPRGSGKSTREAPW